MKTPTWFFSILFGKVTRRKIKIEKAENEEKFSQLSIDRLDNCLERVPSPFLSSSLPKTSGPHHKIIGHLAPLVTHHTRPTHLSKWSETNEVSWKWSWNSPNGQNIRLLVQGKPMHWLLRNSKMPKIQYFPCLPSMYVIYFYGRVHVLRSSVKALKLWNVPKLLVHQTKDDSFLIPPKGSGKVF